MKYSPQKRKIYELFKDGEYHCSTEITFIRDYRKRISEMNRTNLKEKGQEMFDSIPCDGRCRQNHQSNIHMYRLKERPREQKVEFILKDGIRFARLSYV